MNIKINKTTIFSIASFLIPFILFTNYVLNQFYIDGSGLRDVGWFTYMMTESTSLPILNPPSISGTFFQTHFSLFFYLLSFIHNQILFFIAGPIFYSLFIGSMYGIISLSTFIMGSKLLQNNKYLSIFLLLTISVLTSMNGAALSLIGFPHIEIAIPSLILLFIALYFTDRKVLSYFIFIMLLSIREDAGLHIFALLSIIIGSIYLIKKNLQVMHYDLIILAILGIAYSFIAMYIQKNYFPGDNALEHVYLGNPHFAHVNFDFLVDKLKFLLSNREYLYIPALFTMLLAIYTRNILLLSSFLAIFPWIVLSFIAISPMPSHFSNYYAFPFIILSSWPIFAFTITKKLDLLKINYYSKLIASILLITGSSIILFPHNSGNVDAKPWNNFIFTNYSTINATEAFVSYLSSHKNQFGNILVDEPLAALTVRNLTKKQYGYLNNFSLEQKKLANTVVFLNDTQSLHKSSNRIMKDIIIKNNLNHIFMVKDTYIILATNKIAENNKFLFKDTESPLFSNIYKGEELPSQVGKIKKHNRIAYSDTDKVGYITFGPYIKLSKGSYNFDISYSSSENNTTTVGTWDTGIALPKEFKQLKKGNLLGTNNKDGHIIQTFEILKEYSNEKVEIRNFYNGVGNLTIKSLIITKVQ